MKISRNAEDAPACKIGRQEAEKAAASIATMICAHKESEASLKSLKKVLTDYAEQNPDLFANGAKTILFPGGVQLTQKETVVRMVDQEKVDIAWLKKFISATSEKAVEAKLNFKAFNEADPIVSALLTDVGYAPRVETTYQVSMTQKR